MFTQRYFQISSRIHIVLFSLFSYILTAELMVMFMILLTHFPLQSEFKSSKTDEVKRSWIDLKVKWKCVGFTQQARHKVFVLWKHNFQHSTFTQQRPTCIPPMRQAQSSRSMKFRKFVDVAFNLIQLVTVFIVQLQLELLFCYKIVASHLVS